MNATARRGWLIVALVVVVTVLIGTVLAAAAWGGAFGHATGFSAGACPGGMTREWQEQRGDRPDMMDGSRGFGPGMMDEWSSS